MTAQAGVQLAIIQKQVSPIWPASGIAILLYALFAVASSTVISATIGVMSLLFQLGCLFFVTATGLASRPVKLRTR